MEKFEMFLENRRKIREFLIKRLGSENKHVVDKFMTSKWNEHYKSYLSSRKWQSIKAGIVAKTNGMCEVCKIRKIQEIHHLSYANVPGNEMPEDLVAVCSACHRFQHLDKNPKFFENHPLIPFTGSNLPDRIKKHYNDIKTGNMKIKV